MRAVSFGPVGEVELRYRARGVQVHLSILPEGDPALGPEVAIEGWDRSVMALRAACLARWEDLKWLAARDLELDPSGRKWVRLRRRP